MIFEALAQPGALPSLTDLRVQENAPGTLDSIGPFLRQHPELKVLDLSHNGFLENLPQVEDFIAACQTLGPRLLLSRVWLQSTSVQPIEPHQAIKALARALEGGDALPHLTGLCLEGHLIEPYTMDHRREAVKPTKEDPMSDLLKALAAPTRAPQLKDLWIRGMDLSAKGAHHLTKLASRAQSLSTLQFSVPFFSINAILKDMTGESGCHRTLTSLVVEVADWRKMTLEQEFSDAAPEVIPDLPKAFSQPGSFPTLKKLEVVHLENGLLYALADALRSPTLCPQLARVEFHSCWPSKSGQKPPPPALNSLKRLRPAVDVIVDNRPVTVENGGASSAGAT